MLIGEFAELTGLTPKTLRHYDEIGVLQPESVSESGYRHYSPGQLRRAVLVATLREAGVPLAEIAEVRDEVGAADVLAQHRARVVAEREAQDAAIAAAEVTVAAAADRPDVGEREAQTRPFAGIRLDTAQMPDARRIDEAVASLSGLLAAQGNPPQGPARTWTQWRTSDAMDVLVGLPTAEPADLPETLHGLPTVVDARPGGRELFVRIRETSDAAALLGTLTLLEAVAERGHPVETTRLTTRTDDGTTVLSYLLPEG